MRATGTLGGFTVKGTTLLVILFLAAQVSFAQLPNEHGRPHFMLAVCDQVGLNSGILALARQQTVIIFRRAEVDVTWIDLDPDARCAITPNQPASFVVVILPQAPPNAATPDAMGFAPSRTGAFPRAYVFYNWVGTMVAILEDYNATTTGQGIVLGHAIAHELGHLLLPERTHSLTGIMSTAWHRRHWEDAVAGRLLFHKAEAKAMGNNLLARRR
jgi:hypothetical protein